MRAGLIFDLCFAYMFYGDDDYAGRWVLLHSVLILILVISSSRLLMYNPF